MERDLTSQFSGSEAEPLRVMRVRDFFQRLDLT